MTLVAEIAPNRPCDRCGHPSKNHAKVTVTKIYSGCLVVTSPIPYGQRGRQHKAKQCPCDGYVPA
jgi:hypothetical protein